MDKPIPEGVLEALSLADVSGVLGEVAERFDGGEYAVSEETRRVLIDFASGLPDHPLFAIVGHYFAQNPVAGAAPPSAPVGGLVSALQSMRDRMMTALPPKFGDAFDGDFDTLLEAINAFKAGRGQNLAALAQQPAAVDALPGNWDARAEGEQKESINKEWAEWVRENHAGAASAFRTCAKQLREALATQHQETTTGQGDDRG